MKFPLVLSLITIGTLLNTPTRAQNYPWCAIYNDGWLKELRLCKFSAVPGRCQRNWWLLHTTVHISLPRDGARPGSDGAILIERAFAELAPVT
jgi:hypothetical protein